MLSAVRIQNTVSSCEVWSHVVVDKNSEVSEQHIASILGAKESYLYWYYILLIVKYFRYPYNFLEYNLIT
jgi:hypothetical protein